MNSCKHDQSDLICHLYDVCWLVLSVTNTSKLGPAICLFDLVSVGGIRITLSSHNQQQDITALAEALEYHFPKALEETNNSENKIRQAFGLGIGRIQKISELKQQELIIEEKSTIQDIEKLD